MLSRRVGKAFGHGYQARTQIYIGILFLWSIVAMMVMNLLYWSGFHHNFGLHPPGGDRCRDSCADGGE